MQLKDKLLAVLRLSLTILPRWRCRHRKSKDGLLFRDGYSNASAKSFNGEEKKIIYSSKKDPTLYSILFRNNDKCELCVFDHNPFHPHSPRASTTHDLDLCAVEIRTNKLASMRQRRDPGHRVRFPILDVQHLLHVLNPHLVQFPKHGIFAFFFGDVVDSGDAFFLRRQRSRALLAEEILLLAQAMQTSAGTVVGRGGGRWSKIERLLSNPFGKELVRSIGRMCPSKELVSNVGLRRHGASSVVTSLEDDLENLTFERWCFKILSRDILTLHQTSFAPHLPYRTGSFLALSLERKV